MNEPDHTIAQPPVGKDEELKVVLREFSGSSSSIKAAGVFTHEGLSIASLMGNGVDDARLGAMAASLLSSSGRAVHELAKGKLEQLMVKGALGYLVITTAGEHAVLAVLARPTAKLGLLFLEIQRASERLARII